MQQRDAGSGSGEGEAAHYRQAVSPQRGLAAGMPPYPLFFNSLVQSTAAMPDAAGQRWSESWD